MKQISFADTEMAHNESVLCGVTDGKGAYTYLKHKHLFIDRCLLRLKIEKIENMDTSNIKNKFADRIKILRKRNGFTQENLADQSTIHYKYIQRIEGKNQPNLRFHSLAKLAKVLSVEIKDFFNFND